MSSEAMTHTIVVEGLGKRYRLGASAESAFRYRTMRDALARAARLPARLFRRDRTHEAPTIWALRDVSFAVEPGEIVGIIGRNGAGKSTLLKILSRLTKPTEGAAELRGRVGSLLEVATGFHPELTGRDNVFLSGAILGMKRAEISRKFDDIVDFSGVSQFIDTPVKRYSSGMYVRLAFAVAAHLEPEILLVDEVLAVGDAAFQRQCLGKMQDVSRSGRTILLVSHNMSAVTRLCSRAILFTGGRMACDGPVDEAVSRYLSRDLASTAHRTWGNDGPGNDVVRLHAVRVVGEDGGTVDMLDVRRPVGVEITFDVLQHRHRAFTPTVVLFSDQNVPLFGALDTDPAWLEPREAGRYVCTAWIPGNFFNEGTVFATVALGVLSSVGKGERFANASEVVAFQVFDRGEGDTARGPYAKYSTPGLRPLLRWVTARR